MKNHPTVSAQETVQQFWQAMNSNDFYCASKWLSEDFEGIWPQSQELVHGRENFAKLNSYYPANGRWQFTINNIVTENNQVVTDVSITDGDRHDRAITFHTVEDNLISRQVEYWPDPYDPPQWRAQWVEVLA